MKKILVTGALGQIGSELTRDLRKKYGCDNIIASDNRTNAKPDLLNSGPFEHIDVRERRSIEAAVIKHSIDTIYHLSAILSAKGEKNPQLAWDVNVNGTVNILEAAREHGMTRVFFPSSIAVFGPEAPKVNTPQNTLLNPQTMYGITKVAGELLCNYYVKHFKLDVRGCRYPGIISHETLPGGGTTDYAVMIFFEAVKNKKYTCFVREDTRLPMMYMPDCLKAAMDLMEADMSRLKHHTGFNVAAMSFTAGELAAEIKTHIPEFFCEFKPDSRQEIADTWPRTVDDRAAREEWGWQPVYNLASMTKDMIAAIQKRLAAQPGT